MLKYLIKTINFTTKIKLTFQQDRRLIISDKIYLAVKNDLSLGTGIILRNQNI